MDFEVKALPYSKDALTPHMSAETLEFHYEKHHKGYMAKLKAALEGTAEAGKSLADVVRGASGGVFNNAAQVWNHTFFWDGMQPGGGGAPKAGKAKEIIDGLGGFAAFKDTWNKVGMGQFGSGWVWLVLDGGAPKIISSANADNPLTGSAKPLLVCDVWEHAYYIDYRNARNTFLDTFCDHLINWDFVAANAG
jgi:Fe-Mn family superoxide dismutase